MSGHGTESRRLINPFVGNDGYHCFGCDPANEAGLRLSFSFDGESVYSEWTPREQFEGYPGVIHGGIQATVCDEVGGWYIYAACGTAGVTAELHIEYLTPALFTDAPFTIRAVAGERSARRATPTVSITGAGGTLYTVCRPTYAIFPEQIARRRFMFPGREAFLGGARPAE